MPTKRSAATLIQSPPVVLAVLTLTGLILYFNSFSVPFVFDDISNITENPHIMITDISIKDIGEVFKSPSSRRPLANLTVALNYYWNRFSPAGYHAVNLGIHILTAFLLFLVTRQSLCLCRIETRAIPFLTAVLWLAHPLHTQSVTYIIQRMNTLAALFYLLALYGYIRARFRDTFFSLKSAFLYAVSLLAALLGLAAKETTATLPLMLLFYEYYFFQVVKNKKLKHQFMLIGVLLTALVIISLIYLAPHPLESIAATYDIRPFTIGERILSEFRGVVYYISLLFFPFPSRLNLVYEFPVSQTLFFPPDTCLAMIALAGLLVLAGYAASRDRLISFAVLWFLGTLAIESSFIGLALIYEHRTYLPSVFPMMAMVLLVFRYIRPTRIAVVILCLCICFCGYWTIQRNRTWQSAISLWQDNIRKSPERALVCNNLGLAYKDLGRPARAIPLLEKALLLKKAEYGHGAPELAETYTNLGLAYDRKGNTGRALDYHLKALEIQKAVYGGQDPKLSETYNNIGLVYDTNGDYKNAADYFHKALAALPTAGNRKGLPTASIYHNLANIRYKQGKFAGAIANYRKSLAIRKNLLGERHRDIAKSLNNLGLALAGKGDFRPAIECFRQALDIALDVLGVNHPDTAATYLNLGLAWYTQGDFSRAAACMEKILSRYRPVLGKNHPYLKTAGSILKKAREKKCRRHQITTR